MLWKAPFESAVAQGFRAFVFAPTGELLACGGIRTQLVCRAERMLGLGWQEWVAVDDVPRLMSWLAEYEDSGPISYSVMRMCGGGAGMTRSALAKAWAGDAWLAIYATISEHAPGQSSPLRHD